MIIVGLVKTEVPAKGNKIVWYRNICQHALNIRMKQRHNHDLEANKLVLIFEINPRGEQNGSCVRYAYVTVYYDWLRALWMVLDALTELSRLFAIYSGVECVRGTL